MLSVINVNMLCSVKNYLVLIIICIEIYWKIEWLYRITYSQKLRKVDVYIIVQSGVFNLSDTTAKWCIYRFMLGTDEECKNFACHSIRLAFCLCVSETIMF